jgi:hypothetical protein
LLSLLALAAGEIEIRVELALSRTNSALRSTRLLDSKS